MLLSVAVSILTNKELCNLYCDYANKLLVIFVKELKSIYGESSLVYNMHNLLHICDDVRVRGVSYLIASVVSLLKIC